MNGTDKIIFRGNKRISILTFHFQILQLLSIFCTDFPQKEEVSWVSWLEKRFVDIVKLRFFCGNRSRPK